MASPPGHPCASAGESGRHGESLDRALPRTQIRQRFRKVEAAGFQGLPGVADDEHRGALRGTDASPCSTSVPGAPLGAVPPHQVQVGPVALEGQAGPQVGGRGHLPLPRLGREDDPGLHEIHMAVAISILQGPAGLQEAAQVGNIIRGRWKRAGSGQTRDGSNGKEWQDCCEDGCPHGHSLPSRLKSPWFPSASTAAPIR